VFYLIHQPWQGSFGSMISMSWQNVAWKYHVSQNLERFQIPYVHLLLLHWLWATVFSGNCVVNYSTHRYDRTYANWCKRNGRLMCYKEWSCCLKVGMLSLHTQGLMNANDCSTIILNCMWESLAVRLNPIFCDYCR
jgi:hypothetical protein